MRTFAILFSAFLSGSIALKAQTVATFDDLTLIGHDTEYINYSHYGADIGFNDGLAHFPCFYDTSFGESLWTGGFAYSNWADSVSSANWGDSVINNPGMQYAAKTAIGYAGSSQYAVVFCSNPVTYANSINLNLKGAAIGQPVSGFYVTNTSYAWSSMKYGDQFDTMFHTGDWFLLTVKGFRDSVLTPDSVNFYLADYRFGTPDSDYIVNNWNWVNLTSLGHVDSLQFSLSSSNNTSGYMDVPAYFCIDNFTTNETDAGVKPVSELIAKVYPSPVKDILNIDIEDNTAREIIIGDIAGKTLLTLQAILGHMEISTEFLTPGVYMLSIIGEGKSGSTRFVKN